MNQLLEAALKYAELGWHIFPCIPRQKIPATTHGVKDATVDETQIRAWWKKWPNANVAVACGKASGVYAIDVDIDKEKGIDGFKSMEEFPLLPKTVLQKTPRGGIHAFFQSKHPPANSATFRPGISIRSDGYYVMLTPSIHPNGKIYAWATECSPWEIELAEFPDFMRPTTQTPWTAPSLYEGKEWSKYTLGLPEILRSGFPSPAEADVLKRASLYLAQCDPAVEGSGGHNSLLWAAVALVHGFCLSNEQALDLLTREYNPRCIPPWDLSLPKEERDFSRKVSEARKLTPQHPSGWLLEDPAYAPLDIGIVDVERLIKGVQETAYSSVLKAAFDNSTDKKTPYGISYWITGKKNTLPDKELEFLTHPTGLLGELCEWINATAIRKQPLLTLGCALAFCGALFGRKVRDTGGLRTNIYCMGIGKSSYGKAHAPDQIRALCEAASCTDLLGGIDFGSDPSIEARLAKFPATLFLLDEVGHVLMNIKGGNQYLQGIVSTLMKLYSASRNIYKGREYAEDGKQRVLIQPCCCIFGYSTPERFNDGISYEELQDGWLSRCMVFNVRTKPKKIRGLQETPPPVEICDQVHAWFTRQIEPLDDSGDIKMYVRHRGDVITPMPPQQIVVPTTQEAEKIFIAFDNETEIFGEGNPDLACLWAKGEENARKVALIIAASENYDNPVITALIADYACRLIRYLLVDFSAVASTITICSVDARKQKLLEVIKNAGIEGCLKRDITRNSQWLNGRERNAMLADLMEAEEVIQYQKLPDKRFRYWTVSNFRFYIKETEKRKATNDR